MDDELFGSVSLTWLAIGFLLGGNAVMLFKLIEYIVRVRVLSSVVDQHNDLLRHIYLHFPALTIPKHLQQPDDKEIYQRGANGEKL